MLCSTSWFDLRHDLLRGRRSHKLSGWGCDNLRKRRPEALLNKQASIHSGSHQSTTPSLEAEISQPAQSAPAGLGRGQVVRLAQRWGAGCQQQAQGHDKKG